MADRPTAADLEAYLDEALAAPEMAALEAQLRNEPELLAELAAIQQRRDSGEHSLGEMWRRRRLSCPSREELGSFLLGVLDDPHALSIERHVQWVGCRLCAANLADLESQAQGAAGDEPTVTRRRRYFQSSAGYLRRT